MPLLASSNAATFQVQWSGQDDANGAGIASYDIYVSINGGPWTLWQSRTTDQSTVFQGGFGNSYGFYSVARDNAGNTEAAPDTADTTVRVNHDPVAGADSMGTDQGRPASVAVRKLLLNDRDADGDPLTLTLAGTTSLQSGNLALANGLVTYTPPAGFSGADSFTYTLSDGLGGVGLGTVSVTVRPTTAPRANAIRVTALPNGHMRLDMVGIPGRTYVIQVSSDLAAWTNLTTMVAGPNGEFQYEDVDAATLGQRFYRLALP